MGLEQKLSLRLSQRLVMTPTLQQAIKLLQMTRLELQDVVNEEIVANPVLEEDDAEGASTADEGPEDSAGEASAGETTSTESSDGDGPEPERAPEPAAAGPATEAPPETSAPEEKSFDEIDLEAYFGDYMDGVASAPRMTEQGEEFSLENRAEAHAGLAEHLTEQLGVSDAPAAIRAACGFLIGNVDEDGYLRLTLEEASAAVGCDAATAEQALALLQSFDPTGVGGRSLAEVLLIQARALGLETPLLVDLVTNRFQELGSRPPAVLARQLAVPVEEVARALESVRKLDPKPGRRYDSSRTVYVEPDVAVVKVGDDYVVLFNDDGLPRLRVSALYRRMLQTRDAALDGEGRSYLREKMRAAQWLMKSLDQRKRTIVRVAESIVRKQRDFFEYGVAHLRPLVLRDVAEDIGMHESTVSRVVSNKWMATPRGLVPMKFFFHSAIASVGGEDVSSLAVKGKIRALVEAEDAAHPLSDARLAELLAREGIRIARRTVAKYREELRIPSSSVRRVDDGMGEASGGDAAPRSEPEREATGAVAAPSGIEEP